MSSPVLATKLFVPARRPRLVPRPRLAARLDGSLEGGHRLTLVSAPAGFGKSSLLADWAAQLARREPPVRVGWMSLGDEDDDLAAFLALLWPRLKRLQPIVVGTAAALGIGAAACKKDEKKPEGGAATGSGQTAPTTVDKGTAEKADPGSTGQIAAPFAGSVTVSRAEGDAVAAGDTVATIEAMKMEASITSPITGTVQRVAFAGPGPAQGGDLLLVIAPS